MRGIASLPLCYSHAVLGGEMRQSVKRRDTRPTVRSQGLRGTPWLPIALLIGVAGAGYVYTGPELSRFSNLLGTNPIIIDGDTIRIGAERIRILGIDAPEMAARCDAERQLAEAAKSRLADLIRGQELNIRRNGTDRFGRTLAYVRIGNGDVGEMLIRERLAVRWGNGRPDWCAQPDR